MNKKRVVVTGLGVVAANGVGAADFCQSLKEGRSGIETIELLKTLRFRCQQAGFPSIDNTVIQEFLEKYDVNILVSTGIIYGLMAGKEALEDAKIAYSSTTIIPNMGCIFGTGSNGVESSILQMKYLQDGILPLNYDRISVQSLASGVSIYLNKLFGFGGITTTNSSACSTGTEALIMAYDYIANGWVDKMLVGGSESASPFVCSPFDAMFATAQGFNDRPQAASCPLSANASGFVPSAGAGALVVESLESALTRGATIYAEVLGGEINSGGQLGDGSMTIGNSLGMERCIKMAVQNAGIRPEEIDLISGHLTATVGDVIEVKSLYNALNWSKNEMPYLNATKSMIGHALSASGAIEIVGMLLEMQQNFIHPNLNMYPLHEEILPLVNEQKLASQLIENVAIDIAMKISLGFGDVNACVILKKYVS